MIDHRRNRSDRVKDWLARRLALLAAAVGVASVCAALARLHWFLELASHFALHYAVGALALALGLVALQWRRWAAFALVIAAWNGYVVAEGSALFERPHARAGAPHLTIFHFNGNFRHAAPERVADYILANAERIDVVVLIEATSGWQTALRRLQGRFPHALQALEDSPFGIAVLSKTAPSSSAIVEAPRGFRHAELRVSLPGIAQPIAIYALHPPPPMSGYLSNARDEKLAYIARVIRERGGETPVVVGDLNLTPYSPVFASFVRDSGLRAVQSRAIPRNTWPVMFGQTWLGIPIDHSLVGGGATPVSHAIGPALGSDHLPVTVSIAAR
jgi:endonuclease/exonuclease/phosphatase (EEP) superfamily protein YafD